MKVKICTKCNMEKSIDKFCIDRSTRDGLHPWCRDCRSHRWENYYSENKKKVLDRIQSKREEDREHVREVNNRSNAKNRETHQAGNRAYYQKNKEMILNRIKSNRKMTPRYWENWSRIRDRKKISPLPYGTVPRQYEKQNGLCYWCSISLVDGYHVDHYVPLSKGGRNIPENIVISCRSCNLRKAAKMPDDFLRSLNAKRT